MLVHVSITLSKTQSPQWAFCDRPSSRQLPVIPMDRSQVSDLSCGLGGKCRGSSTASASVIEVWTTVRRTTRRSHKDVTRPLAVEEA
uniref:Uncharacterized protein n=1 Tax=Knipowitschia caucasica TaxID=637954 RepID=A0AAV2J166_KNICA